jgi:hypothetical protein
MKPLGYFVGKGVLCCGLGGVLRWEHGERHFKSRYPGIRVNPYPGIPVRVFQSRFCVRDAFESVNNCLVNGAQGDSRYAPLHFFILTDLRLRSRAGAAFACLV